MTTDSEVLDTDLGVPTQVLTVTRPARDEYTPDVLALGTTAVPALGVGDVLVEVLYLSIDPTNRNWLKLEPVNTLVDKVGHGLSVGAPMMGEAVVRVLDSQADGVGAPARGHSVGGSARRGSERANMRRVRAGKAREPIGTLTRYADRT